MKKLHLTTLFILSTFIIGCGGNKKTVTAKATNQTPTAISQNISLNEDNSHTINLRAEDADGDNLTYTIVTAPLNGIFDGGVYQPNADFFGTDNFTFKANDGYADSNIATITITITPTNDLPTLNTLSSYDILEGDSIDPTIEVNDRDGTIKSIVWTENGQVITFPKSDFRAGAHILLLTVTDNQDAIATKTVTVNVTSNNSDQITQLPKTGQTVSYHNYDDGHYQKGASRQFSRDDTNDIVTDHVTGLMWQDDEASATVMKPWITEENYNTGDYNNTNGDTATTYCKNLTLGGHNDWRVPKLEELVYLTYKGAGDHNYSQIGHVIDPIFKNVYTRPFYWSADTVADDQTYAWGISFSDGRIESVDGGKGYGEIHIKCVRGENNIKHNFIRNNSLETILDTATGLMWQDNSATLKQSYEVYDDASNYCVNLVFAGHNDWRLPNYNELFSIFDSERYDPAIKPEFVNTATVESSYWTSTSYLDWDNVLLLVDFFKGSYYPTTQASDKALYARCVRNDEM